MFSSIVLALYAAAAVSIVSGLVVPRKSAPPGWATDYLEPYQTYHVRYLALDCQDKHNDPFFDQCCHPLLATETLEKNRPAQCVPSPQASSSAAAAEPTSTVSTPAEDEDEDCDEDAPAPSSAPAPPAPSAPAPAKPETSSAAPKPKPSTSAPPPPPPSSKAPEPSSTKAAPPAASSPASKASGGDNGLNLGGFATFFLQNGVAGACGKVHSDDDLIVAIDQDRYGNSGNSSPLCGKKVKITNTQNKKTVTATIADDCPTCKNSNSIDLSKGTFSKIADFATGMVPIEWDFV